MTVDEARGLLLSLLPGDYDRWADFTPNSDPWLILDGAAQGLADHVFTPLETVALDADPLTLTIVGIEAWESALALDRTRAAVSGTNEQRQAQITGRLREWGLPTEVNILAAVHPVLGDSATIVKISRAALTALNTYTTAGATVIPASGTGSVLVAVTDNANTSAMGAQVTFTITHPAVEDLQLDIANASIASTLQAGEWTRDTGAVVARVYTIQFHAVAGFGVSGPWVLDVNDTGANAGTVSDVSFFIEGIGRSSSGADGHGSAIFEYAVLFDPALVPDGYDLDAARSAVARFKPAHCRAFLARYMSDSTICAIVDDIYAVADGCICC